MIGTFQQHRNVSNKEEIEKLVQDAQDLLCFLKSNRRYEVRNTFSKSNFFFGIIILFLSKNVIK